jgi:hypothetical protein
MCPYGAIFNAESAAGFGAWVASARQLVKVFTVLAPPHCKDGECLLKASWREQVEERSEYFPSDWTWFVGLGWFLHDTGDGDSLTWMHEGSNSGSLSFLIGTGEENGYAYAAIFNGNNSTGMIDYDTYDTVFDEMAKCVNDDEWPLDFFAADSDSGASRTSVLLGAGVGLSIAFAVLVF